MLDHHQLLQRCRGLFGDVLVDHGIIRAKGDRGSVMVMCRDGVWEWTYLSADHVDAVRGNLERIEDLDTLATLCHHDAPITRAIKAPHVTAASRLPRHAKIDVPAATTRALAKQNDQLRQVLQAAAALADAVLYGSIGRDEREMADRILADVRRLGAQP